MKKAIHVVELGRYSAKQFRALALRLDQESRSVAWLPGHGWRAEWLAFDPVEEFRVKNHSSSFNEIISWMNTKVFRQPNRTHDGQHNVFPKWIGYVAYEAARSCERVPNQVIETRDQPIGCAAIFRAYSTILRRDFKSGLVSVACEDSNVVEKIRVLLSQKYEDKPVVRELAFLALDSDEAHRARIEKALNFIAQGDVYQINIARCFQANEVTLATHLLQEMFAKTQASFAAAIDFGDHALVSTSPELFFEVSPHGLIRTSPIKGTRPRGKDALSDRQLAYDLMFDPKEVAELTMVVDLERSDLGRISRIGSVRVQSLRQRMTTPNVHHQFQSIMGHLLEDIQLGDVFRAMFPSGSVTGTPKIRAMELIASLEAQRRGIYSGAIGMIDPYGSCIASMAIRTVLLDSTRTCAHYYVGGGIVADSDVSREVAETLWKAQQIHRRHTT